MTLPLPHPVIEDQQVQQNFEVLSTGTLGRGDVLLLGSPGTQRRVVFGTATVTITGGTDANSANVAHGLGTTPTVVVGTARQTGDTRDDYVVNVASRGATNIVFSVRGAAAEDFALANPTVVTLDWIAIG